MLPDSNVRYREKPRTRTIEVSIEEWINNCPEEIKEEIGTAVVE